MEPQSQPANSNLQPAIEPVKKCKHTPIIIILAILAISGLGFGGYELWQNVQKDNEIKNLQTEKTEESGSNNTFYKNPIIKSPNPDESYSLWFETSRYFTGEDSNFKTMQIGVENGKIHTCRIFVHSLSDDQTNGGRDESSCTIAGIVSEIYDIIEFGEGQDNGGSNIGFIMADGSVKYFPFLESMKNNSFNANKKLNINGYVVGAKKISVGPTDPTIAGGYGSTVFILNDGDFIKFKDSMLEK